MTARKWSWWFDHPGGKGAKELHVVLGKPVELVLASTDVIHSLYVPSSGSSRTPCPGRYTRMVFTPTMAGTFPILCTEYCGTNHSQMTRSTWWSTPTRPPSTPGPPREADSPRRSPWSTRGGRSSTRRAAGLPQRATARREWARPSRGCGARTEKLVGGGTAAVDENYVRESIVKPGAKIVAGYDDLMPPIPLEERDMLAHHRLPAEPEGGAMSAAATAAGGREAGATSPTGAGCAPGSSPSTTSASASCTWALIVVSLILGGVFALALRLHLWNPAGGLVSNDTYNKLFTLHGAVMIFLFVIPGIPSALGNFVVPLQVGAKDVAFPRVNLLCFWLYVGGAVLFVATLVVGGLDTGWTLYPPYSLEGSRGLGILSRWPASSWPASAPSSPA